MRGDVGREDGIRQYSETRRCQSGCTHFRYLLETRGRAVRGSRLLVVGSGAGAEALYFAGLGAVVSAADPSSSAHDLSGQGIDFRRDSVQDARFQEEIGRHVLARRQRTQ